MGVAGDEQDTAQAADDEVGDVVTRARRVGDAPVDEVGQHRLRGFVPAHPIHADTSGGSAFDPACDIQTGHDITVGGILYPPLGVGHDSSTLIEG